MYLHIRVHYKTEWKTSVASLTQTSHLKHIKINALLISVHQIAPSRIVFDDTYALAIITYFPNFKDCIKTGFKKRTLPKRERTRSGLKSWCSLDVKGPGVRTAGLAGRMDLYLMQTTDYCHQEMSAQPSCLHGERDGPDSATPPHHLPFLETNWEVTPAASNVAKTGLWSLVMMSLVLPAGEGRNF